MASMIAHTRSSLECDFLRSCMPLTPHVFTSEQAELAHINEQIHSLDSHIAQLNSLRSALHHRSRQLHNLLLPIHTLPIEVLSHIFQQAIDLELRGFQKFWEYPACLRRAFVLSSVSARFRRVAFYTPELWRRIPLNVTAGRPIDKLVSLLRHCMTFAPSLDIFVNDRLNEEEACAAVETVFTSEVTRRIQSFELSSRHALDVWITILKGCSFPMLDNLDICCADSELNLDLRTFSTVTRLELHYLSPFYLTMVPSSVQHLFLDGVGPQAFISFLYHCPNLEECLAYEREYYGEDPVAHFDRPLTLTHLKRLAFDFIDVIMTPLSAHNLRLPSLEYLRYLHYNPGKFDGFLLLCHNVSETLTTLKIVLVEDAAFEYEDDLYQLCRLPFPNLRKLQFTSEGLEPMLSTIRVLTRRAEECNDALPHYLPSLEALTLKLRYSLGVAPRSLLELLDRWRVGEASYFHLRVKGFNLDPGDWSPEEKEELKSIVGNRKIGITWNDTKVL